MKLYYKPIGADVPVSEVKTKTGFSVDKDKTNDFMTGASENHAPMSWSASIDTKRLTREQRKEWEHIVRRLTHPRKYPRKLKKAISSWWTVKRVGAHYEYTFHNRRNTKWQRKAQRLVKREDGSLMVPMKDGWLMKIKF